MKNSSKTRGRITSRNAEEQRAQALADATAKAKFEKRANLEKGGLNFWEMFKTELATRIEMLPTTQLTGTLKISPGPDGQEVAYIQIAQHGPVARMTDVDLFYRPGGIAIRYDPVHGRPGDFPLDIALDGSIGLVLEGRDPICAKDAAESIVKRIGTAA